MAVTNYHSVCGCKQRAFILPQFGDRSLRSRHRWACALSGGSAGHAPRLAPRWGPGHEQNRRRTRAHGRQRGDSGVRGAGVEAEEGRRGKI